MIMKNSLNVKLKFINDNKDNFNDIDNENTHAIFSVFINSNGIVTRMEVIDLVRDIMDLEKENMVMYVYVDSYNAEDDNKKLYLHDILNKITVMLADNLEKHNNNEPTLKLNEILEIIEEQANINVGYIKW